MAAPFDANAVTIYGQYSQFELLTSGSSMPEASASVLRMYASGSKLYYFAPGASGSAPKEIATGDGGLSYALTQGAGIASFTYNGSAAATVAVDINGQTATTVVDDADEMLIDDGAGGTIRKMTRGNFLGSALAAFSNGLTTTTLSASGDVDLGNTTSDTVTVNGRFDSDIVPSNDSVFDLGSSALQWAELHVDVGHIDQLGSALDANTQAITNVNIDSGNIDGVTIGAAAPAAGTFLAVVGTTISGSSTISGFDLDMEGSGNFLGDLTVQGNLVVEGKRTLLDTVDLLIEDNLVELNRGTGASGTASTNAGAGFFISGSNADRGISITGASDGGRLKVSGSSVVGAGYDVVAGGDYAIDGTSVLTATTLGSGVVNSSLTSVGSLTSLTVAGTLTANGDVDLGNAATDSITFTGRADSDFLPIADSAHDLGSSALQWAELHVDTANIDQLGSALDANGENITNVGTFEVDGGATFNGAVTLGDAASDVITVTGQLSSSVGMLINDNQLLNFGDDADAAIKFTTASGGALVISGSSQGIATVGALAPSAGSLFDIGNSTFKYRNLHIDAFGSNWTNAGRTVADLGNVTTVDINGGSIDGTVIGAASVANGSFAAIVGTTATLSSTLTANGDVDLGNATSDTITCTGRFDSDLVPSTDSARDLGTSALQFRTAYVDEVESATGVLNLTTAAGVEIAGTANSDGYLLQLPTTGDARARAWVTYSSARHKTNVKTVKNPIDTVKSLRGVTYDWKGTGQADVGFIAEEVGAIVPEVVSFGKDGRAEGIDYGRLTSVLVEAMKQQQSEIEKLQNVVQNLTSEQPSLLEAKQ